MSRKESDPKVAPPLEGASPLPGGDEPGTGAPPVARVPAPIRTPVIRERENDSFDEALEKMMNKPCASAEELLQAWHNPPKDALFENGAPSQTSSPSAATWLPRAPWESEPGPPKASASGEPAPLLPSAARTRQTKPWGAMPAAASGGSNEAHDRLPQDRPRERPSRVSTLKMGSVSSTPPPASDVLPDPQGVNKATTDGAARWALSEQTASSKLPAGYTNDTDPDSPQALRGSVAGLPQRRVPFGRTVIAAAAVAALATGVLVASLLPPRAAERTSPSAATQARAPQRIAVPVPAPLPPPPSTAVPATSTEAPPAISAPAAKAVAAATGSALAVPPRVAPRRSDPAPAKRAAASPSASYDDGLLKPYTP